MEEALPNGKPLPFPLGRTRYSLSLKGDEIRPRSLPYSTSVSSLNLF